MSNGEIVPEVMTTLPKRSKTGAIAKDASRHLLSGSSDWQRVECQSTAHITFDAASLRQMEDWIGDGRHVRLERFEDQ